MRRSPKAEALRRKKAAAQRKARLRAADAADHSAKFLWNLRKDVKVDKP